MDTIKYDFCKLTWPYNYVELLKFMMIENGTIMKHSLVHLLQYIPEIHKWIRSQN